MNKTERFEMLLNLCYQFSVQQAVMALTEKNLKVHAVKYIRQHLTGWQQKTTLQEDLQLYDAIVDKELNK